jgi:archaellum component FlaC
MANDPGQFLDASGRINPPPAPPARDATAAFGRSLAALSPVERMRALSSVFSDLANADWGAAINPRLLSELESARSRLQGEIADLQFQLGESEARREKAERQLATEQLDNQRRDNLLNEQKKQLAAAKAAIEERDARIRDLERRLATLDAQNAQTDQTAQARAHELREWQERVQRLQERLQAAEAQAETVRELQRQIEERDRLLAQAGSAAAPAPASNGHAGALPAPLLDRLKRSEFNLVAPDQAPDLEHALRAVEALEMLISTAVNVDEQLGVIVEKYLNENAMRESWRRYRGRPLAGDVARALDKQSGHPRVLKARLRMFEDWHRAVLFGTEMAFEPAAVAAELTRQMKTSDRGWTERDTLRDYLRNNGAADFADTLKVLRADKIAAAFQQRSDGG